MIASARSIAEQRGLSDRTHYLTGDVVGLGNAVPEADITFMDKVVCCYQDLPALLRTAATRTKRLLTLSHPSDNWLMRPIFMTQIFVSKLFRMEFRPWWHDWERMEEMLTAEGMRLRRKERMMMWTVLVYERQKDALDLRRQ
jgi:magnesium-protoporphyrin O-methyltransferase